MKQLTEQVRLRNGVVLKNRLAIPPMTTRMSYYDDTVTGDEIAYYGMRTGDVGLFVTGVAHIQPNGRGWTGELGVYDDKFISGLSRLAATMKQNGTKAVLQIFHAGRMSDSKTLEGEQPVAPSAIASAREGSEVPRELTNEEIEEIIENFKAATVRAIKAGFDGVELHGANHYLLHQFFSPHSNRRNDQWGGSLEKRYTFIERVVDGVLSVVKEMNVPDFIVGYRFSPREETDPGFNLEETLWLVDKLADKELDYLHISLTRYDRATNLEKYADKSMLQYVYETINGRLPLVSVGDIHNRADLEAALQYSDIAAVGIGVLIDPKWFAKILAGRDNEIRHTLNLQDKDLLMISNGTYTFIEMKAPHLLVK
ncbi:NADH-dependent flavin oxidoreductase [Veillonella intestinalis]|uniref:NADH-dependent flavin oxidoreductase n=1 Tax=Veillonella intestinalis TaxID=2941341 RepID=UPI00203E6D26|nr:NADH-dependent flavin oxidoreductase [Veillonella intestinalis]